MLDTNICIYLIAAHALAEQLTLVTNNEVDFKAYPGLILENWVS